MKNKLMIISIIIPLAALLLTACGGSQTPTTAGGSSQPTAAIVENTAAAAPTAKENSGGAPAPAATPTVDAIALIKQKLQNHHSLDRVLNAHHTRAEWEATLNRMNGYGAGISDAEKEIIIDYLLSRQ